MRKETHQLGLTLTDRAVAVLLCAGPRGISQFLFYELLWPRDYSIDQSKRRMGQLIQRLRKMGRDVEWKRAPNSAPVFRANQLHLDCGDASEGLELSPSQSPISAGGFRKFFSLSKSSALEVCAEWAKQNRIRKVIRGKSSFYQVLSDPPA